ncbi:MAG: SIMPL domain-containing protein [Dehalococcoidia bacterium]|nr:SIMPL domain-containing protein [Dehalococcoidia bacterium]MDW8120346.1 SIMPL domain-containing protein [Chloroflexota bacterium]
MRRYALAFALALTVWVLVGCTRPASPPASTAPGAPPALPATGASLVVQPSQPAGLWVTGEGRLTLTPTVAHLSLGVEARADTVSAARDEAARALRRILDALKANGIAERDIQTRYFTIQPLYTYRERVLPGGERQGEQVLIGYQVSNLVSVKVRALDRIGTVIDDAVAAGGNLVRVQGIAFGVEDGEHRRALAQAREAAVKDALDKARQMASAAGISLGKLISLSEAGGGVPLAPLEAMRAATAPETPTPISPGELTVTVTVQALFALP